jgi:hypothetical protein
MQQENSKGNSVPGDLIDAPKSNDDKRFWIDPDGKIVFKDREACFAFGKYAGRQLRDVAKTDPGYLRWINSEDFSAAVKVVITHALYGVFPWVIPGSSADVPVAAPTKDATEQLRVQDDAAEAPTWREEDSSWGPDADGE